MMLTRNIALALCALGLATSLDAQAGSQEELRKRYEEKLASEWLKNAEWILDLEEAKARAKETGKPIFAYFTRSYAP